MFHKHKWIKIKETYAQTAVEQGFDKVNRVSYNQRQILMFGQTTIILECKVCGKIRKEEMLGKSKC